MEYIKFEDFKKMDIRVGTVRQVESIDGADKLLKCQIDFGEVDESGNRKLTQIISGIKEYYREYENLIGKQLLYIVNLEPRTIKGEVSNGMLMAVDGVDSKPVFLVPEVNVSPGARAK